MVTIRTSKPLEGESFAEFARIINRTKGYVSQLKSSGRLVLTADGKRVMVEESKARMKSTSDPSKWPVALSHEAERRRKAEVVADYHEPIPDPYDDFMFDLLADSRVEIVAGLMAGVGLSFRDASLAFNEIGCCLSDIREGKGYKTTFEDVPNPRDHRLSDEERAQMKTEIEKRVRELELLADEPD